MTMGNETEKLVPLGGDALFGWIECSERLPADFDCVVFTGRNLGCFTGSRYKGEWRVYTPLNAADGRRIMIPVTDLPEPTHWMPLPSLPNATEHTTPRNED